jgi:hypothetical protein
MNKFYRESYIDASCQIGSIWPSSFRGEDFFNISKSETKLPLAAIFVGGMGRNEETL